MPDRIRNLLPVLAIFDLLGPLLQLSWVPIGCCGLAIVVLGSVGLVQVRRSRGCPIDQLKSHVLLCFPSYLISGGQVASGGVGISLDAIFHIPEPESACGSLMAWYSAIVAQGVAPVVKYHLAVACLLEIIYAVGVP